MRNTGNMDTAIMAAKLYKYFWLAIFRTTEHSVRRTRGMWSAYSLVPRPFQHMWEGQGTRLECICNFFYYCPGRPSGGAGIVRQMPYVSPQLSPGGGVGHIIDRCITCTATAHYSKVHWRGTSTGGRNHRRLEGTVWNGSDIRRMRWAK